MSLEIEQVQSKKELRQFISVPWKVYENDSNWVPWLFFERLEFFDKRKNPLFEHAEVDYFIARRGGQPVGTIAAILNHRHNEFQQENVAHFGVFELLDDPEAGLALLETAADWARTRGAERILGPVTLSTNDEVGMLIEGFDRPPALLMPYNPPYYMEMMEHAGFTKAMDLLAWIANLDEIVNHMPPKVERIVGKVGERYGLKIRPINIDDWDAEIDRIKTVYNAAWERNWGFVPMTDSEIEHLAEGLKLLLDPALIFIVERDGEPIGFSLTMPDVNQPLLRIRPGPSLLSSYLAAGRLFLNRYKTDTVRVLALGVIEQYRGRGVDALMYYETAQAAARRGYDWAEASWILETNEMMNRAIELMKGRIYKRYRIWEQELASDSN
ncbi:MAG: GNAT family N-acetyltransferase [Candidatus Promineifilaceae bacterium]|nr:GNAT family N-acetyltransferase [Candidatus Promineifilaceae bacterium]